MYFSSLALSSFRNLREPSLTFGPSFNLFIGKNAQGKTNLIEALGLVASGRSFRTHEHRDMIRYGSESAAVRIIARGGRGEDDLRVVLQRDRKRFLRNDKPVASGGFPGAGAVLFAPEEILLLRGSPQARREYVDELLGRLDAPLGKIIRQYRRIVSQRNRLLREAGETMRPDRELFRAWDEQLAHLGAKIIIARGEWCRRWSELLVGAYATIAPGDGRAAFHYCPHGGLEVEALGEEGVRRELAERLQLRWPDELVRGYTLVGPHRDDFEARVEDAPMKRFGSQGQHRTFIIALKIAEVQLIQCVSEDEPVLLLDDVASELDVDRIGAFWRFLDKAPGQVFITATDAEDLRLASLRGAVRYTIADGEAKLCRDAPG